MYSSLKGLTTTEGWFPYMVIRPIGGIQYFYENITNDWKFIQLLFKLYKLNAPKVCFYMT